MIRLTIDGRTLPATAGETLLAAARRAGIEIPTLCDHPDLEPVGACRLCVVEVLPLGSKGEPQLVTSCLYPVADGLTVRTASARVRDARRRVLALLAARCPGSETILALAARYGAGTDERLRRDTSGDVCITCGLCTRVCESHATSAIATVRRGAEKAIGGFASRPPEECVGCGGCAIVCPTGAIEARRDPSGYTIWDRTFPAATARVTADRCTGCGACEEACPFAAVRVALRADGSREAVVGADACRGCGLCVGACPSGALAQDAPVAAHAAGRVTVFACPRADLAPDAMPEGAVLAPVPCTGRVSVGDLLDELARGRDGVLVLGRHESTCRFNGGETLAQERVQRAARAAELAGWKGRIAFAQAGHGPGAARATAAAFTASITAGPRAARAEGVDDVAATGDLDAAEAAVLRLSAAPGASLDDDADAAWCAARGLPGLQPGRPVLAVPTLAALDVLGGTLFRPLALHEIVHDGLAVLARLGVPGAGACALPVTRLPEAVRGADVYVLSPAERDALAAAGVRAFLVDDLIARAGASLPRPEVPARVLAAFVESPEAPALLRALGHVALDGGPCPLPASFAFGASARRGAETLLARAEAQGVTALYCRDPRALARWALCTREGTWRASRIRPVLGVQLAARALAHAAVDAPRAAGRTTEVSR